MLLFPFNNSIYKTKKFGIKTITNNWSPKVNSQEPTMVEWISKDSLAN